MPILVSKHVTLRLYKMPEYVVLTVLICLNRLPLFLDLSSKLSGIFRVHFM